MNNEEILKGQIDFCDEQRSIAIKQSLKWQRRRIWWCIFQFAIMLPGICVDFYQLRYGWAIGLSIYTELLTAISWWSLSRPIKAYRQSRAEWGALKRQGEQILEQWRGYKQ